MSENEKLVKIKRELIKESIKENLEYLKIEFMKAYLMSWIKVNQWKKTE